MTRTKICLYNIHIDVYVGSCAVKRFKEAPQNLSYSLKMNELKIFFVYPHNDGARKHIQNERILVKKKKHCQKYATVNF